MMGGTGTAMSFFVWNPSLDLGIEAVDAEHRRLFEIVRRLHDGVAAGWAGAEAGEVLRELDRESRAHFLHEEDLLDAAGCPEAVRGRGEHLAFSKYLAELESSVAPLTVDAAVRLRDFLLELLQSDRRYASWLSRARPEAVAAWARRRAAAALPRG
jgi:hemerythrin